MPEPLLDRVRKRAGHRCEYCQMPQQCDAYPFEIEHIVAEQHGGKTEYRNLAFSCVSCNRRKGPNLLGIDRKTGKRAWLFHPRRHKWSRHFRWQGAVLVGRTAMGRATVATLGINLDFRVVQRFEVMQEGDWDF